VRAVQVKSPFDFVSAIKSSEKEAAKQLPLQAEAVFTNEKYSAGLKEIREIFAFSGIPSPLKFRVVVPALQNCDESVSHELDVVYNVFLSNPLDYLNHPAEFEESQTAKPFSTVARSNSNWRIAPSLAGAYNRTTGMAIGGSVGFVLPESWGTMHASALESTAAHDEKIGWQTSKDVGAPQLRTLNISFGYRHSDQPADSGRIESGHLFLQAYATTNSIGSQGIAFRYGALVEGGNDQSSAINSSVVQKLTASSSYGSLKGYSGVSLFREDYTLSVSYGFQAASNGDLSRVGFLKHLGYTSLVAQIPFRQWGRTGGVHRPLSVELAVAGGFLQRSGPMPVPERFFGGDAERPFVEGADWKINDGPFIRSIPQNRLNASNVYGVPVGGSSFWSSNMTVALPVWGRPLVPKELATDPTFEPAIKAEKTAAQNALALTYQKDLPAFKNFISHLPPLDTELSQLRSALAGISEDSSAAVKSSLASSKSATESSIRVSNEVQTSTPQAASALVVGPVSRLTKLSTALERLERGLADAGENEGADAVHTHRENILRLQSSLADDIQKIDLTIPQKRAADELRVVDPVLDALLHKLNIISISPIAVFDCARLWPDAKGTRFGPGTGVRLSLVTLNVNLGYAWNIGGTKPEGPGAIFFSLDVSNFFR